MTFHQKPIVEFTGAKCLRSHRHLAILRDHCIGSLGVLQGGDQERLQILCQEKKTVQWHMSQLIGI